MSTDTYTRARAAWLSAKARCETDKLAALPPDLLAEAQALQAVLREAGFESTVLPQQFAPQQATPARVITAEEVAGLGARDPRRTLHNYQRSYARLGRPVPQHLVNALRQAARDEAKRFAAR